MRNLGESVLPPGAIVRVYRGTHMVGVTPPDTDRIAELTTTRALYPAQTERFAVDFAEADRQAILLDMTVGAFATIEVAPGVQECRADNNFGTLERFCGLM